MRIGELTKRVWRQIDRDNVLGLAAQSSFYFVLSIFPFLIFTAALIGSLPNTGLWDRILNWVTQNLPSGTREMFYENVISLTRGHTSFLSFGTAGTIWAATSGVLNLISALNVAYDVAETRNYFLRVLLSLAVMVMLSILLPLSFLLLTAGAWMEDWLSVRLHLNSMIVTLLNVGRWGLSLFLLVVALSLVDYALPNLRRPWRWVSAGGVFIVIAWVLASWGFNFYVRHIVSYDKTYGALGGFIILIMWIYLMSAVLITGAEVNSEIAKMSRQDRGGESPPVAAQAA